MKNPILLLLVLVGCCLGLARASYLESDFDPQGGKAVEPVPLPPRPVPRPPIVIPVPPIVPPEPPPRWFPTNQVTELLDHLTVGAPYSYRGLTIFPLRLAHDLNGRYFRTLDEGLREGTVEIQETGTVSTATLINRSRGHVFVLAGEMLVGGRQNRMVSADVLLEPGAVVQVPVYCIEQDRWQGITDRFETKDRLGLPGLRRQAAAGAPQAQVWGEVDKVAEGFAVHSKTRNLHEVYESERAQKELADYRSAFRRFWGGSVAGIVVVRGGAIVGADVFGSSSLFSRLQPKILDSYVLEHVWYGVYADRLALDRDDIQRYLESARQATQRPAGTPGAGRGIVLSGTVSGTALSYEDAILHLGLQEQLYHILK